MDSNKNETILVINDDPEIGDFIAEKLLPRSGYLGKSIHTGAEALAEIRAAVPALLLLDLELSDISGFELLHQLKLEGINIPAILFAAHGSEQVPIEALHQGVQDYLLKPIDPQVAGASSCACTWTQPLAAGEKQSGG